MRFREQRKNDMKRKIEDQLKNSASMVEKMREISLLVEFWAREMERQMDEIRISIDSLPQSEDIDVLNRRHYHRKRIRQCFSESFDASVHAQTGSSLLKKSIANLHADIQTALRQAEEGKSANHGLPPKPRAAAPRKEGGKG